LKLICENVPKEVKNEKIAVEFDVCRDIRK